MKTTNPVSADESAVVSLSELTNACIGKCLLAASGNLNSIVNNVSDKFSVRADQAVISRVLTGLLKALVIHTRESQISISARQMYGKMIEVNVKDDNCFNTYGVALSLQDIVPLVHMIGGQIDIANKRQKMTSVSFRFPVS